MRPDCERRGLTATPARIMVRADAASTATEVCVSEAGTREHKTEDELRSRGRIGAAAEFGTPQHTSMTATNGRSCCTKTRVNLV